jgi:hypothetical protein
VLRDRTIRVARHAANLCRVSERLRDSSPFSEDEKSLLEDFLNRCDLIKFARYEATTSDSELLLEEAIRFVKGGQPCLIGSQEIAR